MHATRSVKAITYQGTLTQAEPDLDMWVLRNNIQKVRHYTLKYKKCNKT